MPYVFYDLPADSSELETYNGYHVARAPKVAGGGPVKREDPHAGPDELILHYPSMSTSFPPRSYTVRRASNALIRVAPGRRLTMGGFLTTPQLASLLSVPSLCFVLVWLIGRL
ncbi:MAG: hypothetical protein KDB82_08610 [Planctomycetes bacterium]|nr:hypothetical protein [Planctomycetota bacterium]